MDVPSQMLTFVKVAEAGSLSAASRASGQTPSAISKQIRHLEDHVGCRLLHRTKVGVTLTDEGAEYYKKCQAVAQKVAEAEEHIANRTGHPTGLLHVVSSVAFGKAQLIRLVPKFLKLYPDVTLSLELTDRRVDLETEQIDIAINFIEQLEDQNVITRKIMDNRRVLCASPEFINQFGMPKSFSDLSNFNCLRTSNFVGRNAWQADMDGVKYTVDASGNFIGNSADVVYRATLAGLGIASLSAYMVAEDLQTGRLVRVLPAYTQKHADVVLTFADRRNLAPKIRVFVDFLLKNLNSSRIEGAF